MITAATSGLCLDDEGAPAWLPGPALVFLTLLLLLSSFSLFVFFNQERFFGATGILAFHLSEKDEANPPHRHT